MDWSKIAEGMAAMIESIAKESPDQKTDSKRNSVAQKRSGNQKRCLFWECNAPIPPNHFLCRIHFKGFQENLIDECTGCNRAKDRQYNLCLDCYNSRPLQNRRGAARSAQGARRWYKKEHSPEWERRDAAANEFFVYILKLDNGRFYVGQTRELRERLLEHRDGRATSTAGRNPKLVWFAILPSRDVATNMELELRKLADANPRAIRRMVVRFQDFLRELDYT